MAGARAQIVAVLVLAAATYGVLLRVAEAKVEASVGGGGFPLDDTRHDEIAAFQRLRASLGGIGEQAFAERLERLRQEKAIWVAHELAHHDGMTHEADAYAAEIAWYEGVRTSPWFASLQGKARDVNDWALESAVLTARKASEKAASAPRGR